MSSGPPEVRRREDHGPMIALCPVIGDEPEIGWHLRGATGLR
jgi:hypothetical protein